MIDFVRSGWSDGSVILSHYIETFIVYWLPEAVFNEIEPTLDDIGII